MTKKNAKACARHAKKILVESGDLVFQVSKAEAIRVFSDLMEWENVDAHMDWETLRGPTLTVKAAAKEF